MNKNKNVLVTTNGTINVDKFIQHAKDFKYVNIAVSIEGGKDVNTYIRYPSNWDTILQNFDKLSEYKNFEVVFNSTMNALNVGKFTKMKKDIERENGVLVMLFQKMHRGKFLLYLMMLEKYI